MINQLVKDFIDIFGQGTEPGAYFAPGRVNLIGEHTDYNGGHVFPCALTIGTYAVARRREDRIIKVYSKNFPEIGVIGFSIGELMYRKEHDWANYPKGTIWAFIESGYQIDRGLEVMFSGDIPNSAGLSSSASIELVTSVILNDLFSLKVDMMKMVVLSRQAENKFIGVKCGIMDQFAIGMGRENCAVLLNTNTMKYTYAPLDLGDVSIVIANTNKRRELSDSKYNERRSECEEALRDLQSELSIKALGELSEEGFEKNCGLIKDAVNLKRARHAVYENQRCLKAFKALQKGELKEFGRLMNESHISLRDDYEVTGIELDTLAELSWRQKGVIGSRMTGAGFGGCTVSLVENSFIGNFIGNVGGSYFERIGYKADFYVVCPGKGAGKL